MEKSLDEKRLLRPGPTEEWLKTCDFREKWDPISEVAPTPAFRVLEFVSYSGPYLDDWHVLRANAYATTPKRIAAVDLSGLDNEALFIMFNARFPQGAQVSYDAKYPKEDDIYWLAVIIRLWRNLSLTAMSNGKTGTELFMQKLPRFMYANR
jgi:hypothetical protein